MANPSVNDVDPGAFRIRVGSGELLYLPPNTEGQSLGGWYTVTGGGYDSASRRNWGDFPFSSVYGVPGSGYAGLTVDASGVINVPPDVEAYFPTSKGKVGFRPRQVQPLVGGGGVSNLGGSGGGSSVGSLPGSFGGSSTANGGLSMNGQQFGFQDFVSWLTYSAYNKYLLDTTGSAAGAIQADSVDDVVKDQLEAVDDITVDTTSVATLNTSAVTPLKNALKNFLTADVSRNEATVRYYQTAKLWALFQAFQSGNPWMAMLMVMGSGSGLAI